MIDGKLLAQMFISGANNLYNNRSTVDELNIFPVPDGDTGTNMSMTAQNMAKALTEVQTDSVTKIADTMSFATLRGARGNSGVILSQFFRGMSKALKGKKECTPQDIAAALKNGSDTAYNAVMNPTEGTILTVAREAAEGACTVDGTITDVFEKTVDCGKIALAKTTEMLPVLKKAGVVDAGGQGWVFVLEGALQYLKTGEIIKAEADVSEPEEKKSVNPQQSVDTENIKFMYCTEFIVEKRHKDVNVLAFKKAIEKTGDCMLVIDDDDIVKVHFHTNNPGYVLECAIKLGAMINIKIDNMKHQHQSIIVEKSEEPQAEKIHKKYGFVAICAGDGIEKIFTDLGVDVTVCGGQTMNPSTDDILSAVNEVDADYIYVFPNNKNIILAANQAKELSKKDITVIPTKNITECVAALLKFNENKEPDVNEKTMNKAASQVVTGLVTFAVRDTEIDGSEIHKDDILGMSGGKILRVGKDTTAVLTELVEKISDEDTEFITLYYGEDTTLEDAQKAAELIESKLDEVEVSVKYGGQPLYYYIVSVE